MVRGKINNLIKKAIKNAQKEKELPKFKIDEVSIEHPEQEKYGDYSTNIAMQISKILKKDPMEIAIILSEKLKMKSEKFLEKIEIVEPGFINFFISKEYLQKQVLDILKKGEKFSDLDIGKKKKIQIEFISANPTGPLTIGNARGGPFGDVLGNIFKKAGFKIEKAYYVNDFGNQILALGHSVLKDKEAVYKGKYIDELHKRILARSNTRSVLGGKEKDPYKAGQKAAKIIIDEIIKKTVKKMGIKYDEWFWESQLHKTGKVDEIIEFLKKKKLVYKKDGALWFKSSKYGDNRDRVLVKQDGSKTYLTGDIAYHRYKFEKKKFNKVINIWGADHYGDISGLKAGTEALGHKDKLDIILHQFVTILRKGEKQRMSKRKGVYFTINELLDEISSDVMRFFFLQKSINTHLNFDIALAKEQSEKNPVYYIQYAFARIQSILAKIPNPKFQIPNKSQIPNPKLELLKHPSELNLIKQLIKFPEVVEDTAKDYQVQRLPQYAFDLAAAFHQFYRDCRVVSEDENFSQARLALALATKTVLKSVFDLMGISAPKKM
ncbi:arginine--tRNA ligase [Candidatus Parcubacteria bacterium]|nr:arginine--tRNA ligase [Candidatus Parcubacteria bacterium]